MKFISSFGVMVWFMAACSGAQAEGARKLAVMPFAVHGQGDVLSTQRSIAEVLVTQLKGEGVHVVDPAEVARLLKPGETVGTEEQARAHARRVQADYALFGSFNQVGNTISLDAKLVDVAGRKKTESLFAEERGMENLAAATNALVQQMAVHLLAKAVIAEVRVQGNERIEAEAIKLNVKSQKGELLRSAQVSEDLKAIYKMGYFEKVDADVSDSPAGKVLTFVVRENPTIQELKVTGNKKIKEKDILAAITTKPYTILQRSIINEDVQKIIKLYHQKGYFDVSVKPGIDFPKDPRQATVAFNITEKGKVYIKSITFRGNKQLSARKLRGVMQTKEKTFVLSWFTDRGILQKDILETDVDRVTAFYHDKGFMDAKVGTPEVNQRDDGFHIEIPVEEGDRYKVREVKISGDPLDEEVKLQKKLRLKESGYFSREELRSDIDTITKVYMDEGYARAQIDPMVKRDQTTETAEVDFRVDKGEKMHIGRIFITGNTKTRDKVIRRELKLFEGDLFSTTKMEKSMAALKKLDFFEEVEIAPSEGAQPGLLDLHVRVKEKLTGSISVGGGYSSDDGLFASGEIMQRNLRGTGEYLGLRVYFGAEAQRYVASFTEPWIFDMPWNAGIDVYNWLREYSDFTKDSVGFRVRSAYLFGNYSRFNTFYTFENAKVDNLDIATERRDYGEGPYFARLSSHKELMTTSTGGLSKFWESQEGEHIKSSVSFGLERDTTDHPFLPTRGSLNTIGTEVSSKYLGSDSDFVKAEVHSGWYIPLFWKLVGFVKGEAGTIIETGDESVPVYERYFLGGINSLRAFNWGDVGPEDADHNVIGGYKYVLTNVELLFPLIEKLGMRGVLFFDAGTAFDAPDKEAVYDNSLSNIRMDAGAGVRWNSPMGPLRIEWGYNLDPQPGEDNYKWQFSAGAFF